jgi:hypothetical protein
MGRGGMGPRDMMGMLGGKGRASQSFAWQTGMHCSTSTDQQFDAPECLSL